MRAGADGAGRGGTGAELTAGTLTLLKNFAQNLGLFQPSGTHSTVFAGTVDSVSFASAVNSYFKNMTVNAGTTLRILSDVKVTGAFSRGGTGGSMQVQTPSGSPFQLLAAGLNVNGAAAGSTIFNNVQLRFFDGDASATFNNVAFTGFTPTISPALFEITGATPGTGTLGLAYINPGGGTVNWP